MDRQTAQAHAALVKLRAHGGAPYECAMLMIRILAAAVRNGKPIPWSQVAPVADGGTGRPVRGLVREIREMVSRLYALDGPAGGMYVLVKRHFMEHTVPVAAPEQEAWLRRQLAGLR